MSLATAGAAQAQDVYGDGYGGFPAYSGSYGYAGPAIRGDYIGAPLTQFPRPTQIVPSAWGYGTYGIPTVTGIRQAPTGTPTIYVINAPARATAQRDRTVRSRILSRSRTDRWSPAAAFRDRGFGAPMASESPGGARIVTVNVRR
ncbi:hypothetical protein [Methylobacterium sp. BTF04]|uniref:hypothetical protein n=1 Tax=Methylobacterium sp. BTF04 TaxID=2708300 RepID=UPI001954F385|nr:hypothetical protein [Methylobacterium sp. BTF04]